MSSYIYIYIYIYIHIYTYMYIYIYIHTYTISLRSKKRVLFPSFVILKRLVGVFVGRGAKYHFLYIHIYVYLYTQIHTYAYTCIHTCCLEVEEQSGLPFFCCTLLHLECHLILCSNLSIIGLFSTERGKRDLEN